MSLELNSCGTLRSTLSVDCTVTVCRPLYYQLIDECVHQIVLHDNGVDGDFRRPKRFEVDVDSMIGKCLHITRHTHTTLFTKNVIKCND